MGTSWRALAVVALIAVAGCDDQQHFADDAPNPDAPDGSNPDGAMIDAGVDAPDAMPPDLTALCGAQPVTLEDWEACYQKRVCEWEINCRTYERYRDLDDCLAHADEVSSGALGAAVRERARAIAAGRASIDVANFARCLDETSPQKCNTAFLAPSCALRFAGTVADGDACTEDVDCASPGASCTRTCADACCEGVCDPSWKEGEDCTPDFYGCAPGLMCDVECDGGDCQHICRKGDVGSHCTSYFGCDPQTWCDVDAGICRADFAEGAECTNLLQCGGETSCVGLQINNGNPGHCLRLTEAGDTCDAFCMGNLQCGGSECIELAELGEGCGSLGCLGIENTCVSGQCVRALDVGGDCSDAYCLPGLFCTSELGDATPECAAPGDTDAPCQSPGHCASHLCSGNQDQVGMCLPWVSACFQ